MHMHSNAFTLNEPLLYLDVTVEGIPIQSKLQYLISFGIITIEIGSTE